MNVHMVVKPFPNNRAAILDYAAAAIPMYDATVLGDDEVRAVEGRVRAKSWLHLPASIKDHRRGGRPGISIARSIAHDLIFHVNPATGKIEWWDYTVKVWRSSGGDNVLKGERVSAACKKALCDSKFMLSEVDGKRKLTPYFVAPPPILEDPAFLASVSSALQGLERSLPALDSLAASSAMMVCKGGKTIDFKNNAVIDSLPEHRNSRFTSWEYKDWFDDMVEQGIESEEASSRMAAVGQFWSDVEEYLVDGGRDLSVMAEKFEALVPRCPCLRDVFWGPMECVEDCIFDLREWAGALSGLRSGKVDWVLRLGPSASNGKGTVRKLVEKTAGTFNGGGELGYVSVQDGSLFQAQRKEEGPSELKSNMEGCRAFFVDDADPKKAVNLPFIREICGGNSVTAARKHKENRTWDNIGLLNWVGNEIPHWSQDPEPADLRRMRVLYYGLTFKNEADYEGPKLLDLRLPHSTEGESDGAFPNHRLKNARIKDINSISSVNVYLELLGCINA